MKNGTQPGTDEDGEIKSLGVTKVEPVAEAGNTYCLTITYQNLSEYIAIYDGLLADDNVEAIIPVTISIIDIIPEPPSKLAYTISDAIKSFMSLAGKATLTAAQKAFYDFGSTGITLTDSMMLFMQVAGKQIPAQGE